MTMYCVLYMVKNATTRCLVYRLNEHLVEPNQSLQSAIEACTLVHKSMHIHDGVFWKISQTGGPPHFYVRMHFIGLTPNIEGS